MPSERVGILFFDFSFFDEKNRLNMAGKKDISIYKTFRYLSPYLASSKISSAKKHLEIDLS